MHKTAKGRAIDMAALVKQHETKQAIGNANMNARGDRLDKNGNVIATVQRVAREHHSVADSPETTTMTDAPTPSKRRLKAKKPEDTGVANKTTKTREDGSEYLEIEYDDGSVETQEIDKDALE